MIASYDVLLIDVATGAIGPADYSTPDREEALAFAEGFNRAELDEPLGCWAVVQAESDDAEVSQAVSDVPVDLSKLRFDNVAPVAPGEARAVVGLFMATTEPAGGDRWNLTGPVRFSYQELQQLHLIAVGHGVSKVASATGAHRCDVVRLINKLGRIGVPLAELRRRVAEAMETGTGSASERVETAIRRALGVEVLTHEHCA